MPKVVAIHSFRSGAGKSAIAGNLTPLLALQGRRVGLLDASLQAPALHRLLQLSERDIPYSFNGFLLGKHKLQDAALDLTDYLNVDESGGKIFLIPSLPTNENIAAIDAKYLVDGFRELFQSLRLDILILDIGAGLNGITMPFLAIAEALIIVSRLDQEDLQGTGVAIDIAHKLDVPHLMLLINLVDQSFDTTQVKSQVEQAYDCEVAGVLPEVSERLVSENGIFAINHPLHPLTLRLKQVGERIARL